MMGIWVKRVGLLCISLGLALGCSTKKPPDQGDQAEFDGDTDPTNGEDPNAIPGNPFVFKRITQTVQCKDTKFRLEFRGSILFIFNEVDSIVSIIDVSDKEQNGLWNRIRSLFDLSRKETQESSEMINWAGCDGLAPFYDKADIRNGNHIGRAVARSIAPISAALSFIPGLGPDSHEPLTSLKGDRQLNEALRRLSNIIPVAGFFINKFFAMEDEANLVSIGKALKQLEILLLDNEDVIRFLNMPSRNAEVAKEFFTKSIKNVLLESATPTPLGDLISGVMRQGRVNNAGTLGEQFYADIERDRARIMASNPNGGQDKIFKWLGREMISVLGNVFGLPQFYFVGILLDGHVGHMDGPEMGYLMEEALLAGNDAAYEKARNELRSRAIIPTYREVSRNIKTAYNAVRQFICGSYEVFYDRLSSSEKSQLKDAQSKASKIVGMFNKGFWGFHDGIYGNLNKARMAFQSAQALQPKDPGLFGPGIMIPIGAGAKWMDAAHNATDGLRDLSNAAQMIWELWTKIESKAPTDSMMREKRKLVFLIQEWGMANGQINALINEIYTAQPKLRKGGFADGNLTEYNRRIVTLRQGSGDQKAQQYRKLNDFLLNGGAELMSELNQILAGKDTFMPDLFNIHRGTNLQAPTFAFRLFDIASDARDLKAGNVVVSPNLQIEKSWW